MPKYVGALDQGTTSTRFMIFDHGGQVVAIHQKEHEQIYPKPGWVEHDPAEIWARSQEVIRGALDKAGITASDLAAVGITNQRETAVVWDRNTGKAIHNAIVWQDTRTDVIVNEFAKDGGQDRLARRSACRSRPTSRGRRSSGSSTTSTAPVPRPRPVTSVRQHRHVVHLEPDRRCQRRRPRHRRDQCQPDDADEPRDPRLGRRDPQPHGHPALDAAGHQGVVGGLRDGQGRPRGHRGRR